MAVNLEYWKLVSSRCISPCLDRKSTRGVLYTGALTTVLVLESLEYIVVRM